MSDVRICFVCLGNICRSPTAEAVFRHLVEQAGLADRVAIDSAGTAGYHAGEVPDRRSTAAAERRGIALRGRARRFDRDDFERFDYVVAMDRDNRRDLLALARGDAAQAKVHLLRDFSPRGPRDADVPDPYYGDGDGFERVLDICTDACQGLLDRLRRTHELG
jgi:protein-tyrosine phosphatase